LARCAEIRSIGARGGSTLSADTKDALAREVPSAAHCRAALRSGLLLYGGVAGPNGLAFRTRRPSIARLFRSLLDERTAATRKSIEPRLYRAAAYETDAPEIGIPPKPRARCDRRMELRGAFLAAGSLATPARGYHLEFSVAGPELAERLAELLISAAVEPNVIERKGRWLVYLKGLDAIVDLLTTIGAFGAVLQLEDVRALKETKNRIHRLVNSEAANVVRAAAAAADQRDGIAYLADAYGLRNLTPVLREAAQLRLTYPDETLAELGRRCVPPVGKATLNGRIATLMRLVRRLRERPTGAPATGG